MVRWPLQPVQPLQKTQLQPPFGPSVYSLCHPWFTTTNLSSRSPIFETSATALCGTTGKLLVVVRPCVTTLFGDAIQSVGGWPSKNPNFYFDYWKWTNIEGIEMDQIPKQWIHFNYTSISITSIVWPFQLLRFFWFQASVQRPTWRSSLSSLMRLLTAILWAPDACSRAWLTYKDLDLHPIDGGWQWSISKNWGGVSPAKMRENCPSSWPIQTGI